jgi:voltage-gated potassium channel
MRRWWSHRIVRALVLLGILTIVGTGGYMLIERWTFADALFMSVVILSTVGLEAPHPLSPGGRAFTIVLIVTGVGLAAYVVSALGEYVTGGVFTGVFRRRRLARAVRHLTGHYIVCGHGRVGRQIVEDLRRRGCAVVIIESAEVDVGEESNEDLTIVSGDASDDAVLARAGVSRAKGLVAATGSDATNLVIVLSARALAPDLVIIARASDPSAEPKLARAGATHIVSPYAIGGHRMVAELLSPGITAFFDTVMHAEELDLWLDVGTIASGSSLVGETLGSALPTSHRAVNLVALRQGANGSFTTNPAAETRLAAGDTLVVIGPQAAIQHIGERATASGRHTRQTADGHATRRPEHVG